APTLGPLAILIDAAAGRVNHFGHEADQWTVSSELTLEFGPGSNLCPVEDPRDRVVATAHVIGRKGLTAVALCTLSRGADVIGCGTVPSYFASADDVLADRPDNSPWTPETAVAELMAVRVRSADEGIKVLMQEPNSVINNRVGAVYGGVAAAGLEMAASAAIN